MAMSGHIYILSASGARYPSTQWARAAMDKAVCCITWWGWGYVKSDSFSQKV